MSGSDDPATDQLTAFRLTAFTQFLKIDRDNLNMDINSVEQRT